ncbi:hypothetical protein AB4453_21580 [Vibrio atlanticus]|uniref:hypothetical protein n=1 Tax=Vibrio atlanticus TaxID=693153 RepID=UPI003551C5F4
MMYLFVGILFYSVLPSWIRVNSVFAFFFVSQDIVDEVTWLSLYYWFVIFIAYSLSKSSSVDYRVFNFKIKQNKLLDIALLAFLLVSFLYVLFLTFTKATPAISAVSRGNKIEFYYMVVNSPGFMIISWMTILYSVFFSLRRRNRIFLLFQLSLVLLDLITSSREYILSFLLSYIVTSAFLERKIPIYLVFLSFMSLVFISILRTGVIENGTFDLMSGIINGLGEFIFTWETSLAVLNYGFISDENILVTILLRMLPSGFSLMVGDLQMNYQNSLDAIYGANFGLGSSIITEGLVKGNWFVMLHPIFICLYFHLSNMLNRTPFLFSRIYTFVSILSVYSIFRGSFYISLGENHYVLLFYLYPLVLLFFIECGRKIERKN